MYTTRRTMPVPYQQEIPVDTHLTALMSMNCHRAKTRPMIAETTISTVACDSADWTRNQCIKINKTTGGNDERGGAVVVRGVRWTTNYEGAGQAGIARITRVHYRWLRAEVPRRIDTLVLLCFSLTVT